MGNFCKNVTVKGPHRQAIVDFLVDMGGLFYVSPTVDTITTIAANHTYLQNSDVLANFARTLSQQFQCPALAVINHDDDVFAYVLYDGGGRDHAYNSSPWYFNGEQPGGDFDLPEDQIPPEPQDWENDPDMPAGGDAAALIRLFAPTAEIVVVGRILHAPDDDLPEDDDDPLWDAIMNHEMLVDALDRHIQLLDALNLPRISLKIDVRYLSNKKPVDLEAEGILKIGAEPA